MLLKHKLVHFALDRSTVDLSAVVRQLVDLYQPAMDERHHELTVDLEDHVVVDADYGFVESRSEQSDRERNRSLTRRMPDNDSAAVAGGISEIGDRRQWSRISA